MGGVEEVIEERLQEGLGYINRRLSTTQDDNHQVRNSMEHAILDVGDHLSSLLQASRSGSSRGKSPKPLETRLPIFGKFSMICEAKISLRMLSLTFLLARRALPQPTGPSGIWKNVGLRKSCG